MEIMNVDELMAEFRHEYRISHPMERAYIIRTYLNAAILVEAFDTARKIARFADPDTRRIVNVLYRRKLMHGVIADIRSTLRESSPSKIAETMDESSSTVSQNVSDSM